MLVGLSDDVARANREWKSYLQAKLYRHHRIERMKDKARRILHALFERYMDNPLLLSEETRARDETEPSEWHIERQDENPNRQGSAGIFADATPTEVFFDNLNVRANQ